MWFQASPLKRYLEVLSSLLGDIGETKRKVCLEPNCEGVPQLLEHDFWPLSLFRVWTETGSIESGRSNVIWPAEQFYQLLWLLHTEKIQFMASSRCLLCVRDITPFIALKSYDTSFNKDDFHMIFPKNSMIAEGMNLCVQDFLGLAQKWYLQTSVLLQFGCTGSHVSFKLSMRESVYNLAYQMSNSLFIRCLNESSGSCLVWYTSKTVHQLSGTLYELSLTVQQHFCSKRYKFWRWSMYDLVAYMLLTILRKWPFWKRKCCKNQIRETWITSLTVLKTSSI